MRLAEGDGCASHGLFRLPWHVSSLRSGKVNGTAKPRIERLARGVIKVHGDRGFPRSAIAWTRAPCHRGARKRHRRHGLYRHVPHRRPVAGNRGAGRRGPGRLRLYRLAPYVAPAGGTKPLFGTNPSLSAGRAAKSRRHLDQASAAMAARRDHDRRPRRRQRPEGRGSMPTAIDHRP